MPVAVRSPPLLDRNRRLLLTGIERPMTSTRLVSLLLAALAVISSAKWAAADEQQRPVAGISIAEPNAGWVEISPDTTLAPSQDANVASEAGEETQQ
jgi:hypothetical protein